MNDEEVKSFPLQRDRESKPGPVSIPWAIAEEAYQAYAQRFGTSQSLERLAERGGFAWGEMDLFLPGWRERVDLLTSLRQEVELLDAEVKRQSYALRFGSTDEVKNERADELESQVLQLEQIRNNLKGHVEDRQNYAGRLEVEVERLRREYEEPGVRCCHGHLVLLPRKVWDCPLCVRERAKAVETSFLVYAARVLEGMTSHEAGAGVEFDAVTDGFSGLINERVLARLREFNEKGEKPK